MKLSFDDTFNISAYGGKLFEAAPLKLDYTLDIPDVESATPEGKEVTKLINAAWTAKMAAWKKDKEKEYKIPADLKVKRKNKQGEEVEELASERLGKAKEGSEVTLTVDGDKVSNVRVKRAPK